jgi:hypothetical protein
VFTFGARFTVAVRGFAGFSPDSKHQFVSDLEPVTPNLRQGTGNHHEHELRRRTWKV